MLPENHPSLEGFNFGDDFKVNDDRVVSFLLLRGLTLPSLKYENRTYSLDLHEDGLSNAIQFYKDDLQRKEETKVGLIVGPNDAWQFSLLIYVAVMVSKSAPHDIKKYIEKLKEEDKFGK
jgi:hypothetical protein